MSTPIKGRRIYPDADGLIRKIEPWDYGIDSYGVWMCRPPDRATGEKTAAGSLRVHQVTEHEDGTITVSPSILINHPSVGQWHGYLKAGVWTEC